MLVKIHDVCRRIVAICDSDLIDRKFEEGNRQLDLTGGFFKGDEKTREEVAEIMKDGLLEDACFNIVGRESVGLAKELGVIDDGGVIKIEGVEIGLILM